MYSEKVQKALKQRKIKVGDRVVVKKLGRRTEGLLMPQTGAGDPETLVVKLDNGYNVGIKFKNAGIEKTKGRTPANVKKQEEYELGKTRKGLLKLKFSKNKPAISIISVGGTIASRVDYQTGGVKALEDPKEFLHNVPELGKVANVRSIERPFTKMSEDMEPNDWMEIAKIAAKRLNAGDKGVLVTHGTDFLHYTAAALSFFLRDLTKPVVLVGAQRSSDRGSSDAGMNIICSAHAAIGDIAEVGICMHGRINDDYCLFSRGTHVRKMDTQRRDAFRPINEYPLAHIWPDGKTKIKNYKHKKRQDKGKVTLDAKFEPKVALLKAYPGSDPSVIDYLAGKGYKGFVIEAGGLGHVPTNGKLSWIPTIKKHVKDGLPFVTAPQTIYGRINPNVYSNLRALYKDTGAIPGADMLSEVAYIKLGWVLGHKEVAANPDKVREMMLTNYAGEITSRSLAGTFLY
jgi:glutamyl-tRNA(Gln) amidotransferase subunit D